MATTDHREDIELSEKIKQVQDAVQNDVCIVEYVTDRGTRRNYWAIESPDAVESHYITIRNMLKYPQERWISTSSEDFISRIRLGIAQDEIDHKAIVFMWKGELLHPNEYGALDHWPDGFCDYGIRLSEQILKTSMAKHKRLHPKPLLRHRGCNEV